MLKKPTNPNKVKLDPIFPMPAGAEDVFVYTRQIDSNLSDAQELDELVLDSGEFIDDTGDNVDDGTGTSDFDLATPDSFVIATQTLRRSTGGVHVVDVVFAIEEVPGATDYEVEIAKI